MKYRNVRERLEGREWMSERTRKEHERNGINARNRERTRKNGYTAKGERTWNESREKRKDAKQIAETENMTHYFHCRHNNFHFDNLQNNTRNLKLQNKWNKTQEILLYSWNKLIWTLKFAFKDFSWRHEILKISWKLTGFCLSWKTIPNDPKRSQRSWENDLTNDPNDPKRSERSKRSWKSGRLGSFWVV